MPFGDLAILMNNIELKLIIFGCLISDDCLAFITSVFYYYNHYTYVVDGIQPNFAYSGRILADAPASGVWSNCALRYKKTEIVNSKLQLLVFQVITSFSGVVSIFEQVGNDRLAQTTLFQCIWTLCVTLRNVTHSFYKCNAQKNFVMHGFLTTVSESIPMIES